MASAFPIPCRSGGNDTEITLEGYATSTYVYNTATIVFIGYLQSARKVLAIQTQLIKLTLTLQ